MGWLAIGGLLLLGLFGLAKLFIDAKPAQVKAVLAWFAGGLGLVLLLALLIGGRGAQALWAAALFGPAAWRFWKARRAAGRFAGGPAGQASEVETANLAMGLDHATGQMTGRVKAGRYAGHDLADLDLPALLGLMAELAALDPDGAPLLEAWLDRSHPDWRAQTAAPPPGDGPMDRAEALAVLGLVEGATPAEIRTAHRRLMRAAHPDQGGSDWLASRLNEARDRLLA